MDAATASSALWSERHQPRSEAELVIAKKKVQDVRDFLVAGTRRVLILRGPPGSGKASVLHALCADLGLRVVEWSQVSRGPGPRQFGRFPPAVGDGGAPREPLGEAFLRFLAQTDRYTGLAGVARTANGGLGGRRRTIALVREFPYTLFDRPGGGTRGDEFLERFHAMLAGDAVQRAVLCFNDTREDHRLTTKLLAQIDPAAVATVSFDSVARTFAQKALDNIARAEGANPASANIAAIAAECGGDLRHAINALQLVAAGSSSGSAAAPASQARGAGGRGAGRGRGGRGAAAAAAASAAASQASQASQAGEQLPLTASQLLAGDGDANGMRAPSMSLFPALGRLLWCKRTPPKGALADATNGAAKRRKKASADEPEPRQLPFEMLWPKRDRPPLYFVPEEVLASSNTDPAVMVDWIFTNAPRFCGDVEDLAASAEAMAGIDSWSSALSPWGPGGSGGGGLSSASGDSGEGGPWDGLAAGVHARSYLDANLHPVPPAFGDPSGALQGAEAPAFNMVRPLMMDVMRHRRRRYEELRIGLEATGPSALGAAAPGNTLLLRTLPFVHLMLQRSRGRHPALQFLPHSLMMLAMELSAFDGSVLRRGVEDRRSVEGLAPRAPLVRWVPTALADDPIEDV